MDAFGSYIQGLDKENYDTAPNADLRTALPTKARRLIGAFFTPAVLADTVVSQYSREFSDDSVVLDPTCGAGDLLLAVVRACRERRHRIPWDKALAGRDLMEPFVAAARKRILLALNRSVQDDMTDPGALSDLKPGCGLSDTSVIQRATHIFLNPPYGSVQAPSGTTWKTGRVCAAALFLENVATNATPGTRIAAILPDVLRSGAGYDNWRAMISGRIDIDSTDIVGADKTWADVDVFILRGVMRQTTRKHVWYPRACGPSVGESFHVSVGAVVDYRSPRRGPWRKMLKARGAAKAGAIDSSFLKSRRFEGTVVHPPFVAVRRTSRPGDRQRALGFVVTGSAPVAVENHLLVLKPFDASESSCRNLLANLGDPRTSTWLDNRIRCRHLTVGILESLPWWPHD